VNGVGGGGGKTRRCRVLRRRRTPPPRVAAAAANAQGGGGGKGLRRCGDRRPQLLCCRRGRGADVRRGDAVLAAVAASRGGVGRCGGLGLRRHASPPPSPMRKAAAAARRD